jgi:outer membrane autotransporter protein
MSMTDSGGGSGDVSVNVGFSLGGSGGGGGKGDAVVVDNEGSITTLGDASHAIFAQSVGGSGGMGGASVSSTAAGSGSTVNVDVSASIGGSGGTGNDAGEVSVSNKGLIDTYGEGAYGILAQSVGGGGGMGGTAKAETKAAESPSDQDQAGSGDEGEKKTVGVSVAVGVGGKGGGAGDGGKVTVNNTGDIITRQADSLGIFAQSVGGGGGAGGMSMTDSGGGSGDVSVNVGFSLGGSGGGGGKGDAVVVDNEGSITTLGDASHAIFAQSVGGSGGMGGASVSTTSAGSGNKVDVTLTASIGGSGGSGNDAGEVSVSNKGLIDTYGEGAYGILAQSVGGGGGHGGMSKVESDSGEAKAGSTPPDDGTSETENWSINIAVGGNSGIAGDGGAVNVVNEGDITTRGVDAHAIFAQSVGGGGGYGGVVGNNTVASSTGTISIGGGGGAAGHGGQVDVTTTGNIKTEGNGSFGIFAQSVGGGGGFAGDIHEGVSDIGTGLSFGQGGGNGGDGGDVSVHNHGDIETKGSGSIAIFAQSVGGGGGLGGDVGLGIGFAGSVGGIGKGGDVEVDHTGNITTYGDGAHGIFAQSVGGKEYGGEVKVTVSGDITVHGKDALPVIAQSIGQAGKKDIKVIYESGTITGNLKSGVGFLDGDNNAFENHGTVTTVSGISGTAVSGTTGNETIDNYGKVIGTVDLGAGANTFNNKPGGLFNAGQTVNLGSGQSLTNAGTLSPGGKGTAQTTTLSGNLTQTGSGTYAVDLDFAKHRPDRIDASGTANVAGAAAINLVNAGMAAPGKQQVTILSGAGGVTNSGLTLSFQPSQIITYDLLFPNATDVMLGTNIEFRQKGLKRNQTAIADAIDAIQRAGGSTGLAPFVAQLFTLPDVGSLGSGYDQLSPVSHDNFTLATFDTNRQYTSTFQHRMNAIRSAVYAENEDPQTAESSTESPLVLAYNGSNASIGDLLSRERRARAQLKYGLWLQPLGQWGDQNGKEGQAGYKYGMGGMGGGFDYLLSQNLIAGVGIGYFYTDVNLDQNSGSGRINSFGGSLYGTYFTDRFYLEGVFAYARNKYDDSRNITIGSLQETANSSHYGNAYSGSLEGGYNLRAQEWIFQPFASLGYVYLDEEAFDEEGAGGASLRVDARQTSNLLSGLGLRVGHAFKVDTGSVIPELKASWLHNFDIDNRPITASFTGFPGTAFVVTGKDIENNGASVGAGITYLHKSGITISLDYTGEFWGSYESNGVYGQLRYEF